MTPAAYQQALQQRGFTYNSTAAVWVGPFNVQVSGYLNDDNQILAPGRSIDNGYARADAIRYIDEQLRARRGLPRPPLVKPANPFSPDYQPYIPIMPPGQ